MQNNRVNTDGSTASLLAATFPVPSAARENNRVLVWRNRTMSNLFQAPS
jgi:hypothetical protein